MAIEVKMPRLSLTMESGVVLQWRKAVGDAVRKGEELAEIETDKAGVGLESPATGYVRKLLVAEGMDVPCDTPLAILSEAADEVLDGAAPPAAPSRSEAVSSPPIPSPEAAAQAQARPSSEAAAQAHASPSSGGAAHVPASPAAKHLARQLGIDLATVTGTGPGGRVGLEDVQRAADAREAATSPWRDGHAPHGTNQRRVPLTKMRAGIAQRMILSATTVPQFTVRRPGQVDAAPDRDPRDHDINACATRVASWSKVMIS